MKTESKNITEELVRFIDESPSVYHVVDNIKKILDAEGFCELLPSDEWQLEGGGSYYLTKNNSTVIAFKIPQGNIEGFNIAASHSDFPCFKLKGTAEKSGGEYVRINTEKYGGMICSTWLDRPLGVAGRVVVKTECGIETRLVCLDRDMLIIPNVAIHMKRDINDGMKYNPAVDMVPLYSASKSARPMLEVVAESVGVDAESILSHDLFLYNRQKGSVWGEEGDFVSSRSLDDLMCAYATLAGFVDSTPTESVAVYACFDNEEVGSSTKQGAASELLLSCLQRIAAATTKKSLDALFESSFMLSCDNAHALHPNYPELSDRDNAVRLNGGIVIKYNAQQKYTTDAISSAIVKTLCDKCGIPYQEYANRSDIAGGSTLGGIASTRVPVNSADIGIAQLAMHSSYETAGAHDTERMARLCRELFSSAIRCERDGIYTF